MGTYRDPNIDSYPHDIEPEARVVARNADGRPVMVEHYCKVCGRLVTGSGASARHVNGPAR